MVLIIVMSFCTRDQVVLATKIARNISTSFDAAQVQPSRFGGDPSHTDRGSCVVIICENMFLSPTPLGRRDLFAPPQALHWHPPPRPWRSEYQCYGRIGMWYARFAKATREMGASWVATLTYYTVHTLSSPCTGWAGHRVARRVSTGPGILVPACATCLCEG